MKKNNRILLKIVAMLLCLVLITTCVVSSTLARFVIEKEVGVPIKFKAFGVTLDISNSSDITEVSRTTDGNSVTVTYSALTLNPGVTKDNVIRFVFGGQQTVPVIIELRVLMVFHNDFVIADSAFDSLDADTPVMPLKFKVGTLADKSSTTYENVESTDAWQPYTDKNDMQSKVSQEVCQKVKTLMDTNNSVGYSNGGTISKSYSATEIISFKDGKGIGFGFEWPLGDTSDTSDEAALRNAIENHLANKFGLDSSGNEEIPLTITFTFTISQKN